jgi:hypothetical protein
MANAIAYGGAQPIAQIKNLIEDAKQFSLTTLLNPLQLTQS